MTPRSIENQYSVSVVMTATFLLDARNCLDICGLLYKAGSEHFDVFHTSELCEVT